VRAGQGELVDGDDGAERSVDGVVGGGDGGVAADGAEVDVESGEAVGVFAIAKGRPRRVLWDIDRRLAPDRGEGLNQSSQLAARRNRMGCVGGRSEGELILSKSAIALAIVWSR
jgi:hypothetical protein